MTSARTRERLIQRLADQGIRDQRVLDRIRHVPRHLFVDEALASRAYEDTALPIGYGQTISQPYIVARMTEALITGGPLRKVLEIGTGCGYQTAVLSVFATEIYTIERIEPLLGRARRNLRELKIRNVRCRHDDGIGGWPARAPFDGILLAAAPHSVPPALFEQLGVGGRLIAPVGPDGRQELMRYTRTETRIERQPLGAVSFVPLLSGLHR
ncbi:MAG TPA: protein-L-isoaspartate(D-aspartate) O-methyltransferase [Steroidobacteraceae bacterium]|nr:protein-L-isoaspartate(D-aspartate) O-methyltransferase [Steroidobacteraceae bacterium]